MTNFIPSDKVVSTVRGKGTRFMTVVFQKKDGTIRKVNGLTKPLSHIKGTGRPTPKGYIAIYSPNETKWSMFRTDHVLEIK